MRCTHRLVTMLVAIGVLIAGCGGAAQSSNASAQPSTAAESAPETSASPPPGGLAARPLDGVEGAPLGYLEYLPPGYGDGEPRRTAADRQRAVGGFESRRSGTMLR